MSTATPVRTTGVATLHHTTDDLTSDDQPATAACGTNVAAPLTAGQAAVADYDDMRVCGDCTDDDLADVKASATTPDDEDLEDDEAEPDAEPEPEPEPDVEDEAPAENTPPGGGDE